MTRLAGLAAAALLLAGAASGTAAPSAWAAPGTARLAAVGSTPAEVAGAGASPGVKQVVGDDEGFCALLTSGGVDCWGYGLDGELGDGTYNESAIPRAVKGVGGAGTLTGVSSLASDGKGICAVLTSGGVDCWGYGGDGELGEGSFAGSNVPVKVEGIGGSGVLTGVSSLASFHGVPSAASYCALLTSGQVACWGFGYYGELGNGKFYTTGNDGSDFPVAVKGVGGSGTLTGVASLTDGFLGFCAVLTSGGVDCWGSDASGQLGQGSLRGQTAVPLAVKGLGRSGLLTGVSSLTSQATESYCALLTSGGVDCWGSGGGGTRPSDTTVPVQVRGLHGSGTLSGVASLASTSGIFPSADFCAVLTSGGVDCWGDGHEGQLGNGSYGGTAGESLVPVTVKGAGGTGTLTGVASVRGSLSNADFCAIVTSGGVDCWGYGQDGELGHGTTSNSDFPVTVAFP